jgi:hypothetical protein
LSLLPCPPPHQFFKSASAPYYSIRLISGIPCRTNAGIEFRPAKAANSIEARPTVRAFLLFIQEVIMVVIASFTDPRRPNSRSPHFGRAPEISPCISQDNAFFVENSQREYLNCDLLCKLTDFVPIPLFCGQ